MLVATLKGINLYNALTDNFERINKDTGEGEIVQNTLNCDFVNCLLTDGDIIWVGTEVGGLNKMSRRMLFVQTIIILPPFPEVFPKIPSMPFMKTRRVFMGRNRRRRFEPAGSRQQHF